MSTTVSVDLTYIVCGTCGCPYMIPTTLHDISKRDGGTWHCPNGHPVGWTESSAAKVHEQKLEQAVARHHRAEKQITEQMAYARRLERQLTAQKAATTRAKNKTSRSGNE